MTRVQKAICWAGAVASLVAAGYSGISVVFYAWLNAVEPDRWPSDRAAVWVYSWLTGAVLFAAIFVVCVVLLVRDINRKPKGVSSAT